MKALIIPFAGALLVGIGGAAAASIMRRPPEPVAATAVAKPEGTDSVRVIDSTDVHGALPPGDASAPPHAAEVVQAGAPSAATPAETKAVASIPQGGAAAPPLSPMGKTPATPAAAPAPKPGAAPATPGAVPEQRIARVFASMDPRDAAKVLEQMSDPDVATILGNLTEKQNALILAKLPAPRVATLSKLGMRAHGTQP